MEDNNNEHDENEHEQELFQTLVTRAASYTNNFDNHVDKSPSHQTNKRSKRNAVYIKCRSHNPPSKKNDQWRSENSDCSSCVLFNPNDSLPNGVLPTRKAIIDNLLHLKDEASSDGQTQSSPTWSLSKDIALHWIFCNVYPKSPNSIQFTFEKLWDDLKYLRNYDNKKKNDSYWKRYDKFVEKVHLVPDLIESDDERRKVHEKL